jgi:Lamin Tail Domain/PEP-CTERM motif
MKKLLTTLALAGAIITGAQAQSSILITEINSNGTGGDFFELYNYGGSTIDLAGYLWTDNSAPAWNGASTYTLNTFLLAPGQAAVFVSDGGQNGVGNAAFVTSWGSPLSPSAMGGFSGPIPPNSTLTGRGLGSNDAVLLWDPSGNFVSGVNYGTTSLTVTSAGGTSSLLAFNRAGGGTSAGGQAGIAGGGAATVSLVWDPTSGTANPTYQNAVVGQWGAFANAASPTTIGSPGVVPEPSSSALLGLGTMALLALHRLNRKA